ncbi:MAG TPA: thioredoxin family protein [Symbiobacteriaceae bacterium]|nr:thioredoxin family protein [Symbiobacteriaceae bacterium]
MTIKVLGGGCANCNKLEENALQAARELGMEAAVEHVKDYPQIMAYGVMRTPGLVVNEKVVVAGKVATVEEIKPLLAAAR